VAQAYNIPRVVIGTTSHYSAEIASLRAAVDQGDRQILIHGVDSFFPAGDEQVLIFEISGRTVPPGGLPLDLGIVVINATTAATIADAVEDRPVTRRLVTVTGEVARPTIVDAPVGTLASRLIATAGGATVSNGVIVKGGPMMGKTYPMDEADHLGFGKADGALIVLPGDHPLVARGKVPVAQLLNQTQSMCVQCQMCTDLCPRYLIGLQMRPHRVMRSLQTGVDPQGLNDALMCCECGICELYACPMGLSPRRMNVYVKGLLRAEGAKITDRSIHPDQSMDREHRRVSQARLIERLGLGSYPTMIDDLVRLDPDEVRLATRHGVGLAARPCVSVGDHVVVGQPVATVDFGEVGAPVHASIDGLVVDVTPSHIRVKKED
jgi:Na+-translocating ferredoxin:NAD+ oxidoreductase RnfC subunit